MIQFILRLMSNKNSHLSVIHNEFLNIHRYIHIYHCQVCICCFYCLACYNCILWTKIDKWLSYLLYSTLQNNCTVGYFLINIFCVGMHFFYHSYLQKSGRYCRCIPKNFQVCTYTKLSQTYPHMPYARHYKPRLIFFFTQFSL